jgi:hypothetical protein
MISPSSSQCFECWFKLFSLAVAAGEEGVEKQKKSQKGRSFPGNWRVYT